ncbi:MAG: beta-ketoacyl-[acyl-carrier-protein] synthase family protein [Pirellulales bacterium]|nr:beta-ketoacyl-[acyl-carrier-protein] synthase family protein [Pirellulales bacterium]
MRKGAYILVPSVSASPAESKSAVSDRNGANVETAQRSAHDGQLPPPAIPSEPGMTRFAIGHKTEFEPVVITGIGLVTSTGLDRETAWQAIKDGRSGVQRLRGVPGIPDDFILGATVDVPTDFPGQRKEFPLARRAAEEAITDAGIDLANSDRDRFGCSISGVMGDTSYVNQVCGRTDLLPDPHIKWWEQWLPNSCCWSVAQHFGFNGPRTSHSVACASGLVDALAAVRNIQDGQCDVALTGSSFAIDSLFASGFQKMRVLAEHEDPAQASRPFDAERSGFVMGEGAAMFIVERLSHAVARGAKIYSEIAAAKMQGDAHHVTGLDQNSESLSYLISSTLRQARLRPADIGYINAHGTGTQQNDAVETRAIRDALGTAANQVCVSSTKSMIGHLVCAAGSVELAITALALRDGFFPPTINLTSPDPACDLDYLPLVGRRGAYEHALKISVAFGGHLVAFALRRWDEADSGFLVSDVSAA